MISPARGPRSMLAGFLAGLFLALTLAAAQKEDSPHDVLRVRGLIVEDEEGRARIVLGAPVAQVEGRRRTDPSVGMLILDENGFDRVSVGSPTTAPQAGGEVHERVGAATGIEINDEAGNERAGFGYLAGGRVVLGIDHEDGSEAVTLFLVPEWGFAGLTVSGRGDGDRQRVFLGTQYTAEDAGMLNLDDPRGRWMWLRTLDGEPAWQVRAGANDSLVNLIEKIGARRE